MILFFTIVLAISLTACSNGDGTPKCLTDGCKTLPTEGALYCENHSIPDGDFEIEFEIKNDTNDPYIIHVQPYETEKEYDAIAKKSKFYSVNTDLVNEGETRSIVEEIRGNNDYSEYEGPVPEFSVNQETGIIEGKIFVASALVRRLEGEGMVHDTSKYNTKIMDISFEYNYQKNVGEGRPLQKVIISWDGIEFTQK